MTLLRSGSPSAVAGQLRAMNVAQESRSKSRCCPSSVLLVMVTSGGTSGLSVGGGWPSAFAAATPLDCGEGCGWAGAARPGEAGGAQTGFAGAPEGHPATG